MTPQRHAILTYLYQTNSHPTADEIYKSLEGRFPNMSVATVYNNLRVFKEANLIQELSFGDNSSRFEANLTKHYHIICRKCNHIEDFSYPCITDIEKLAEEKTGFIIDSHCVEVYGLCQDCQKLAIVE
ncbi:transcriptional repressor [Tepidibacillus marianensis]|uniref:Fur family transcriptional regulator n=1 Tax=Tepidibacillus marianensis TaxID=3131995 RepID=UPI0030D3424B